MAVPSNLLASLGLEPTPEQMTAARAEVLRRTPAMRPALAEEAQNLGAIGPNAAMSPQLALAAALRNRTPNTGAYELFGGDSEDAVRTRAEGINTGLRGMRAAGNLGLLTGDRVLSGFGQAQLQGADKQEAMLADAGQFRAGQSLKQALAAEEAKRAKAKQEHDDAEREKDRAAQKAAAAIQAGDKALQAKLDNEAGLRKEVTGNDVIQEYQKTAVAMDKVRKASVDPSAAGDLALIFGYMKVLDPGSVVKETEFANAQNAANVPDRIRNTWNRIKSGERLNPDQRAEFIRSAETQFAAIADRAEPLLKGYREIAAQSGLDPERVIVPGITVPRTTPTEGMPKGPDGNPTLDFRPASATKPAPGANAKPLNTEAFVYTRPSTPKPGGVYMFNPKGQAFWVPEKNAAKAREKGWKDVP